MMKCPFCQYTVKWVVYKWAKTYNVVFVFDQVLHFHRTLRVYTIIGLCHCYIVHFFGAFFTPITFWGYMSISISTSSSNIPIIERQTVYILCCLFACTRTKSPYFNPFRCGRLGREGGSVPAPRYLSSGALKILELNFPKTIRS